MTILFADGTGSTALCEQLDSESPRALMRRCFTAIKGIVERHGGTVEKLVTTTAGALNRTP